jgi:hypothetical protein
MAGVKRGIRVFKKRQAQAPIQIEKMKALREKLRLQSIKKKRDKADVEERKRQRLIYLVHAKVQKERLIKAHYDKIADRRCQGQSGKQIAEVMGLPKGIVREILKRAKLTWD